MNKIKVFLGFLLAGTTGPVAASIITITINGEMQAWGTDDFDLNGASYTMTTTIDTSAVAYNQTSGASFDTAYYQWFDTDITFTGRPNGASDATATSSSTIVRTGNWYNTSLNTDDMEIIFGTFGGEFLGLKPTSLQYFFTSDVFGPDGFADIPESWTEAQQSFEPFTLGEFTFSGFTEYSTQNMTITTEISAVPVPAAIWLFGSGLLALTGLSRRKR